jgi:hypothetical protein
MRQGCVDDSSCTAATTDLSGTWSVTFLGVTPPTVPLWLTQTNATLNGWISPGANNVVPIGPSSRGADIGIIFPMSCRYVGTARLANPCLMLGYAQCATGPFSLWIGKRAH